jgi:hypothetical protein
VWGGVGVGGCWGGREVVGSLWMILCNISWTDIRLCICIGALAFFWCC